MAKKIPFKIWADGERGQIGTEDSSAAEGINLKVRHGKHPSGR